MESWRKVWREGFVPVLSNRALTALREALIRDDVRLIQGATSTPPPLMCVQDWPVEAACGLGYCGWQGESLATVGEVEEYFARACYDADARLGDPAACRWFLNWFDDTPRDEMVHELLTEVELALEERCLNERSHSDRTVAGAIPDRSRAGDQATGSGQTTKRLDPIASVINPLSHGS